jgi:hypothetical protein
MRALLLVVLLLGIGGTRAWAQSTSQENKPTKVKRQTNLISEEEISAIRAEAADAYAVVSRLRPQFLRLRGTKESISEVTAPLEIKVVVDNAGRGGIETLRQIPTSILKEIRYLNGTDASIQFGTNFGAGAILVFTR